MLERFFVAMIIPIYLYLETILRGCPCRVKIRLLLLLNLFKIRTLHLSVLNFILFTFAQVSHIYISFCNFLGESEINIISSAKPRVAMWIDPIVAPNFEACNDDNKLFIKRMNNTGPSLLPCNTPLLI